MLLLLRLPRRQPFVKLFLTDHFQHAVHFVMTEAAQFHANCIPVTSTGTALASAARNRSAAQIELLARFNPTNRIVVSTVQTTSSVVFPCEYDAFWEEPPSRYFQTR